MYKKTRRFLFFKKNDWIFLYSQKDQCIPSYSDGKWRGAAVVPPPRIKSSGCCVVWWWWWSPCKRGSFLKKKKFVKEAKNHTKITIVTLQFVSSSVKYIDNCLIGFPQNLRHIFNVCQHCCWFIFYQLTH